jgi:hypothetical protein
MSLRFLSLNDIRVACGLNSTQVSDTDLTSIGEQAEFDTERELNTIFTPRTVVEVFEGDGSNRLVNLKNPLLKVRQMKIDTTSITPSTLRIDSLSGNVWLTSTSEFTYLRANKNEKNLVRVMYDYGYFEADTVQTTTTSADVAGDSVTIDVVSSTGFTANDYVQIVGMDSMIETVKVTSVPGGGTSIVVDNLTQTHESGSMVIKQRTPKTAIRLMAINASLKAIGNVIASKLDSVQSYSIGEESVSNVDVLNALNGTLTALNSEKTILLNGFRIRPGVA